MSEIIKISIYIIYCFCYVPLLMGGGGGGGGGGMFSAQHLLAALSLESVTSSYRYVIEERVQVLNPVINEVSNPRIKE